MLGQNKRDGGGSNDQWTVDCGLWTELSGGGREGGLWTGSSSRKNERKMSSLDEMLLLHLLPGGNIESLVFPPSSRTTTTTTSHHHHENKQQGVSTTIPVDILETQNEFHFFMDVPGLSKTDIQVTVEDDNILVIRSNGKKKQGSDKSEEEKSNSINNNNNGKRKRESSSGGEEEGCKYIRLERRASPKFLRKFRLPENSNVSAITAKCENGVLTVTVEKLPPPPNPKTVQVTIS